MNAHPAEPCLAKAVPRRSRLALKSLGLCALFCLGFAAPQARSEVLFTRTTANGEGWAPYMVTFWPSVSGNYTLSFNIIACPGNRDSSIFIDNVVVTNGTSDAFASGFESPVIAANSADYPAGASGGNVTATLGDWNFTNFSGVISGNPGGAWGAIVGAEEGNQRAFIQAYNISTGGASGSSGVATLSKITTANSFALTAGQPYTLLFYQASRPGPVGSEGVLTYQVTLDLVPPAPVPGPVGPQGPAGPTGATGSPGLDGAPGANGAIGPQGPVGAAGANGAAGPQGPQGLVGPVGPQGSVGLTGAAGPQGPVGATGATGAVGPTGAQGLAGPAGAQGLTGPIGPQGAVGPVGPVGAQGAVGAVGPQGSTGPIGPQGPRGEGLVSNSYLLLVSGTTPPPGYTYVGSFTEGVKAPGTVDKDHDKDSDGSHHGDRNDDDSHSHLHVTFDLYLRN